MSNAGPKLSAIAFSEPCTLSSIPISLKNASCSFSVKSEGKTASKCFEKQVISIPHNIVNSLYFFDTLKSESISLIFL